MRNAFADEVTQLAAYDHRIVLLSGDIGNKLFDGFKQVDAARFYNCGVAEANMMGVAAGMALSGLRPIIYTITPFTTTRCFEQIRVDVCYHHVPVIIVGTGSGLSYAELGPTHHSLEDLAILRTLPGLCVLAPADAHELRLLLRAALRQPRPVYMRIGKKGEPYIHTNLTDLEIGQAIVVKSGEKIALIATGTLLPEVIEAGKKLSLLLGYSVEIVSFPSIKPLDTQYLEQAANRFKLLVTIEEHGIIGGLGSAIAEWQALQAKNIPQLILGTPDEFMHEVGSQTYARAKYGLTAETIAARVMARLESNLENT
jgi:transketolase